MGDVGDGPKGWVGQGFFEKKREWMTIGIAVFRLRDWNGLTGIFEVIFAPRWRLRVLTHSGKAIEVFRASRRAG